MLRPLLTVGIPTYNSAHLITDAVVSIMRQGIDDLEIVIVDNASSDNTQEVVSNLNNPHIRYFRNDVNTGMAGSWNRCVAEGRGTYFKFLCADDALLEGVLAKQISVLDNHPDVVLVTCDSMLADSLLNPVKVMRMFPDMCSGARVVNACLSGLNNYVGNPSAIMFRYKAVEGITVDPSYRYILDLKFSLEILGRGGYANIGEPGYLCRDHPTSETNQGSLANISLTEFLRLVDDSKWWNFVNVGQAIRLGGQLDKKKAIAHLLRCCSPLAIKRGLGAFNDVRKLKANRYKN
jgi:glycosyltransferase involved in cell wall biosynthesis